MAKAGYDAELLAVDMRNTAVHAEMIWHPRTEADARRMAWDADDWLTASPIAPPCSAPMTARWSTSVAVPVASPTVPVCPPSVRPEPQDVARRKRKAATFTSTMPTRLRCVRVLRAGVPTPSHDEQRRALEDMATICRPVARSCAVRADGDTGPLCNPVDPATMVGWAEAVGLSATVTDDPNIRRGAG